MSDQAKASQPTTALNTSATPPSGDAGNTGGLSSGRPARRNRLLALEPRYMFDGAGLLDGLTPDSKPGDVLGDSHGVAVAKAVEAKAAVLPPVSGLNAVSAMAESAANPQPNQILFLDPAAQNASLLLSLVKPGIQVVVLDDSRDGISQISEALRGRTDLSAIYLVSHGSQGDVRLGTADLNEGNLAARAADLAQWRDALAGDGDILIYGCDVAAGDAGTRFIANLAQATGADVAASSDATGASAKGGNWVLERQTGRIDSGNPFDETALLAYDSLLAAPTFSSTPTNQTINEDTSLAFSSLFGTGHATLTTAGSTWEAAVSVSGGSLSDGQVSASNLAAQGDMAGINTFLASLSLTPVSNSSGSITVTVTVEDYTNRANTLSFSFDVTVRAVNDAPVGTANTIAVNEDGSHVFTAAEFGFTDPNDSPANALAGVKITTLPAHGSLSDNGSAVSSGQVITLADITAGKLVFTPAANANGNGYGNFTFQVKDDGGTSYGGVDTDVSARTMTINVTPVNDAPTTGNLNFAVNKNASLTSLSLSASDVDGGSNSTTDAAVSQYKIVAITGLNGSLIKHGGSTALAAGDVITVAEATNMSFTPTSNYVGNATFTFQALDAAGAVSNTSTVTIAVQAVNMAPTVTAPASASVNEDSSVSISGVSMADVDGGSGTEQITLSANHGKVSLGSFAGLTVTAGSNASHSLTVQGTLASLNSALATLSYAPDADYPNATSAGSDSLSLLANDLGNTGGSSQTGSAGIAITVNPVADAPHSGNATLAAVNEDSLDPAGASVASLISGFSDVDGNSLAGIAISADASIGSEGRWQYSVDGGAAWSDLGSVSSASALLLDKTAMLRFIPSANWNGTPGTLSFHAIDNSGSRSYSVSGTARYTNVASGASDIDAAGGSLGTSITSVPDPFVIVNDFYVRLDEGGSVVINGDVLKLTSVEASPSQIVYTIQASGTDLSEGQLRLDSAHDGSFATLLTTGSTFTQADLDAGYVRYSHNGAEPATSQTLAYTVAEGGTSLTRSLTIKVSPVNDIPVLYVPGDTPPGGTLLSAILTKGASLSFSTSQIQVADPDNTNAQLVFALASLPNYGELTLHGAGVDVGTVFSYANLSQLVYTHDGSSHGSDSFQVTLRDGAGGVLAPRTVNLVIGTNNAPVGVGTLSAQMYEDPLSNAGVAIHHFTGYYFNDTDQGASGLGVAVVGNAANSSTEGVWQYSSDGSHWSAIGAVNDNGQALVLAMDTLVRFVPALDYNGHPGNLSLRALDNTYSGSFSVSDGTESRVTLDTSASQRGGSTAISDNINSLSMTVMPVDDDPTLVKNDFSLGSGQTVTVNASQLAASDVDSAASLLTYALQAAPQHGWLMFNGQIMGVGSTFTQDDLAHDRLQYQNVNGSADAFTVSLADGGYNPVLARPSGLYDGANLAQVTVQISITGGSPAPIITGGSNGSTGNGDGSSITLAVDDNMVTGKNTELSITPGQILKNDQGSGPLTLDSIDVLSVSHGTLTVDGDGVLHFTPETDYVGSDAGFDYTMRDATTTTDVGHVTIQVLDNIPPGGGGAGTGPSSSIGGANDSLVTTKNAVVSVTPANLLSNDSGPGPLILTGIRNASHGTVVQNPDGSISFTPDAGYVGTGAGFDYDFKDSNDNTASAHVAITVLDVNLAPNLAAPSPLVLDEGSVSTIGTAQLGATDGDTADSGLIYCLTSFVNLNNGRLFFDTAGTSTTLGVGAYQLSVGDSFSQADVTAGYIKFAHNGTELFLSSFNFSLSDGATTRSGTLQIDATPVNDTPTITGGNTKVKEGGTVALSGLISANDGDGQGSDKNTGYAVINTLTYSVAVLPAHGELRLVNASKTYDGNDATTYTVVTAGTTLSEADLADALRYVHDGSESTTDTVTIRVNDNSGAANATADANISIKIIPVNDDPTVTVNQGLTSANNKAIYESQQKVISVAELLGSDPDNTDVEIQFRITANVQYGQLLLDGKLLGVGSAFTVQDIRDGKLAYKHDGLEGSHDSFNFTLSDGGGGNEPSGTFDIDILALNDTPTISLPTARNAAEDVPLAISGISIGDPDSVNRAGVMDTNFGPLSVTLSAGHGKLHLTASGSASLDTNDAASITLSGRLGDINATLASLIYTGDANFNGSDAIHVYVADQGHSGADPDDPAVQAVYPGVTGDGNLSFQSASADLSIQVAAYNDAPSVSGLTARDYTEDGSAIVLAAAGGLGDVDLAALNGGNGDWGQATLSISRSGGATSEDVFSGSGSLGSLIEGTSFTLGGLIKGTVTSNSGGSLKLTFADGTSSADVQAIVQQIAYSNSRQSLGAGETASLSLTWTVDDGDTDPDRSNGQGSGGHLNAGADLSLTLHGANDAPTRSGSASFAPASLNVTEDVTTGINGDSVSHAFSAYSTKYADADSSDSLAGVAITGNTADNSEGHWQYSTNGGTSWQNIANDGSLSSGNALVLAATDRIRFVPDGGANFNGTPGGLALRLIDSSGGAVTGGSFVDVSGDAAANTEPDASHHSGGTSPYADSSNAITLNATVAAVNDAPTISANKTVSDGVTEGSALVIASTSGGVGATVVDDLEATRVSGGEGGASKGLVKVTVSVSNGSSHGKIDLGSISGVSITAGANASNTVTLQGSLTAVNAALDGLQFTPGVAANTSETVVITVNDLGNSGTSTTAGNALSASQTITIDNITQVNNAPTASGNASLTAVNEDAGSANPTPNSGNYSEPTGATVSSLFSAKFSDVDASTSSHTFSGIAIVANAATAGQGSWQFSLDSGSTWQDVPTGGLSDSSALTLSTTAKLRFLPDAANFNGTPGALTVRLSDGNGFVASANASDLLTLAAGSSDGWSNSISLTTSVTAVNDAPTIANLDGDNVSFVEAVGVNIAGSAVFLDNNSNGTPSLSDAELTDRLETTFAGATLTVQNHSGSDSNDLYLVQNGADGLTTSGGYSQPGSGIKQFNNGSIISRNGTAIATITDNGVSTGSLVLTFKAAATKSDVDAVMKNLVYSSKSDTFPAGTKDIDITFNDGNTGAQGSGGAKSTTATVHITMTPSNDAPSFSSGISFTAVEDTGSAGALTTSPVTPATLGSLLSSKFSDPDGLSSNLAGVAISTYNDAGLGHWQVSLDNGSTWVNLSDLNTTISGGISTSQALLLDQATRIQFAANSNANTVSATAPSLTVFAVENAIPTGASTAAAPAITFTSDANAPLTYDTTADTLESRVSATGVALNLTIAARNDAPVLDTSGGKNQAFSGTLVESSAIGVGTPSQQLVSSAQVADPDLATTANLNANTFGAGSITVHLTGGVSGDQLTVSGSPGGIASTSGGSNGADLVITLSNSASLTQVNAILEALRYQSTSDTPPSGTRAYTITLSDGNNVQSGGNAGGASALSAQLSGSITITQENDPPVVDLNGASAGSNNSLTWTEGANTAHVASAIAPAATLSDVDNTRLTSMSLTVSGVLDGASEVLTVDGVSFPLDSNKSVSDSANHFDISYDAASGIFSITPHGAAVDTVANFQTLLRGVSFIDTSDNPTAGLRSIVVQVRDAGTDNLGSNDGSILESNTPQADITVVPANDQPRLSGLDAVSLHENQIQASPAWIDQDITLVDVDSADYNGGSITISGLISGDLVSLPGSATAAAGNVRLTSGTVQYHDGSNWLDVGTASGGNASNFVISLTGNATAAIAERILENLTFSTSSDAPGTSRTLSYAVNDGDSGGSVLAATLGVTIVRDNDAPNLSAATRGGSYVERTATPLTLVSGSLSVSDPDAMSNFYSGGAGSLRVALDGYVSGDTLSILNDSSAAGHISIGSGKVYLGGVEFATYSGGNEADLVIQFDSSTATPTAVQTLLAQLRYSNTSNDNPTVYGSDPDRVFTITLNDGGNLHDSGTDVSGALQAQISGTISLTPTADAPVLSAANAGFTEGGGPVTLDNAFSLNDVDDTQAASAFVRIISNLDSSHDLLSVAGTALGQTVAGTNITVTGYDSNSGTLSLSGLDSLSHYRDVLRTVQFNNTSEDPAGNALSASRGLTWSVTDADANGVGAATGSTSSSLTLTPVNDAPSVQGLDGTAALTFVQGGSAITLDDNASLNDLELVNRDNWAGARLSLSRAGGASSDDLFGASGSSGSGLYFSGGNVKVDGVTIGSVSNSAGSLSLSFNSNATNSRVNAVLHGITYANAVTTPGSLSYGQVTLRFTVDDQNTDISGGSGTAGTSSGAQAQGQGGALSGSADIQVSLNRLPVAHADSASVAEGLGSSDTSLASGDVTPVSTSGGDVADTDQDNDALTVQGVSSGSAAGPLSGHVGSAVTGSHGSLTLAADGSYTYTLDNSQAAVQRLALNETLSDTFSYTVADGRGGTATTTLTVTITGSNDAPSLSGPNLAMNQTEDAAAPVGAMGSLVSSFTGGISDTDSSNPQGVAIVASDNNHGTWYYSLDNGSHWTSFNADASHALLLSSTARLYFQPTADWHGSLSAGLTLRAWDASSGSNGDVVNLSLPASVGGDTAYSSTSEALSLTVTPVNDQPVATLDVSLSPVAEDSSAPAGTTLSSLVFGYSDATDNQSSQGGGDTSTAFSYLAIVGASHYDPAQGTWQVSKSASPDAANGADWISVPTSGLSSSHALVFAADRQIRFVPAGDFHGTPGSLNVRLADASAAISTSSSAADGKDLASNGGLGATQAWNAVDRSISVSVTALNDAPTLSGSTQLAASSEGNPATARTAADIAASLNYGDAKDNQSAITGGGNSASSASALAIVANAATASEGLWQYTLDGSHWQDVASNVADSSAIVLDLGNANHQIRFQPAAFYSGTPGGLSLRLADGSWSGASGQQNISADLGGSHAFSSTTASLGVSYGAMNDAPAITDLDNYSPNATPGAPYAPGTATIIIDPDLKVADQELSLERNDWSGATLSISRHGGASSDDQFGASGNLSLTGDHIQISGTDIGSYSNSGGVLSLSFNSAATTARVNAALQAITYRHIDPTPNYASVVLDYVLDDQNSNATTQGSAGTGQDQGDGGRLSSTAQITIFMNHAPTAHNDTAQVTEGLTSASSSTVSGNLITDSGAGQDTDEDHDVLTVQGVASGGHSSDTLQNSAMGTALTGQYGSLNLASDGSYTYTLDNSLPAIQSLADGEHPPLSEVFTYSISDGKGGSSTATLTLTITGSNDAPVISLSTGDSNSADLTETNAGLSSSGQLSVADIDLSNTVATDVKDVSISGATLGLVPDQAAILAMLSVDSGNIIDATHQSGSLHWNFDSGSEAFDYLADGEQLVLTYTVRVTDSFGATDEIPVTLTITGSNDGPVAVADTGAALERGGIANAQPGADATGDVLANDTDKDVSDSHIVQDVNVGSGPALSLGGSRTVTGRYGSLTLAADGQYRYSVDDSNAEVQALRLAGQSISEDFGYTVRDSFGATSHAVLTVSIHGANDTPVALDDQGRLVQDTQLTKNEASGVLSNDSDVDGASRGEQLTVSRIVQGGNGADVTASGGELVSEYGRLHMNQDGSYDYVADGAASKALWEGDSASDTFTYTVTDAAGASTTAQLVITIKGVKQPLVPQPGLPESGTSNAAGQPSDAGGNTAGSSGSRNNSGSQSSPDVHGEDGGRPLDLRGNLPFQRGGGADQGGGFNNQKLESTDRGFPVTRLQADAGLNGTVQGQQRGMDRLFVYQGVGDTSAGIGQNLDYRVPKDAFGHTNSAAIVQLEASLADGKPLPEWLDFDPTSGTFSGRPPADAGSGITIKVTARDDQGREATCTFKIRLDGRSEIQEHLPETGPDALLALLTGQKATAASKSSMPFTEQLKFSRHDPLIGKILATGKARSTVPHRQS